jgi:SAM-dependent methyltransferase
MVAIAGKKKESIFRAVSEMYADVAAHPDKAFHFPTGRAACRFVGYPEDQLDALPKTAVESFAGVGYPFSVGAVETGRVVLDVGAGSGTDILIASSLVGPRGTVYGLDMTPAMLQKAARNVELARASNVELIEGNAEKIPLPDGSVDVVTSNGVLNLVPDKPRAFAEIFRVLRPGGRLQIADIVLGRPIKPESQNDPQLWAECIVGAVLQDDYLALFERAGFANLTVMRELDYFAASEDADTRAVAAKYGAKTIVLAGARPF